MWQVEAGKFIYATDTQLPIEPTTAHVAAELAKAQEGLNATATFGDQASAATPDSFHTNRAANIRPSSPSRPNPVKGT